MPKKKYPSRVRFFVADDIRSDTLKPMVIGLFPDGEIGVPMPISAPPPSKEKPIVLQGIAILASLIDCKGPFSITNSLFQPDGSAILENQEIGGEVDIASGMSKGMINFIAKFSPFAISQFGKYKFIIKLDNKKEYSCEFVFTRQELKVS